MEFFARKYSFWAGLAGGCFLTTASHGTDQLMVQRLLSARDERQSRTALLASWVVIAVQFTLFLLIGLLLYVYYGDNRLAAPERLDRIYPAVHLAQSAAGSGGPGHCRDPGRRHGQPERGAEFAGLHHGSGFYPRAWRNTERSAVAATGAPGHRGVGRGAAAHRHPGQPVAFGAGGRTVHRLHSFGRAAGGLSAGSADRANRAKARPWREWPPVLAAILYVWLAHAHRVHLVRADRDHRDVRGRVGALRCLRNGSETMENAPRTELKRDLGTWPAMSIVVGTVIGSGIFLVPKTMIQRVGSVEWVFVVWVVGGLLSLAGALSYAELAAALPEAGGEYVFLREAYGPLWGFIYSWTQMWVAKSGSIATLATGFFLYLSNFFAPLDAVFYTIPLPLGPHGGPLELRWGQLFAIALIALLGWLNYFGVKLGGNVQVAVTGVKVALIGVVIVAGLGFGHPHAAAAAAVAPVTFTGFIAALVAALWAYDGWNNVSMVSSEIRTALRVSSPDCQLHSTADRGTTASPPSPAKALRSVRRNLLLLIPVAATQPQVDHPRQFRAR